MSTRYVWNKQKIAASDERVLQKVVKGRYTTNLTTGTLCGYCCSKLIEATDGNGNATGWKAGGSIIPLYYGEIQRTGSTTDYWYFVAEKDSVVMEYGSTSLIDGYWWGSSYNLSGGYNYAGASVVTDPNDTYGSKVDISAHTFTLKGGAVISKVSSGSKSSYPTTTGGGKNGDYWYTYLGSDSIDPTEITYQTEKLRPGDGLTVSVTPRANTYGGTISYLYQYKLNNGSWVSMTTTSELSVSFTIPANAKTIQFRVRAQDDMGFTSTTYITGAVITVERLNLWVGVDGKARKGVDMWIGVNGKARKVVGAWVGVDGKARRFL